MVLRTLLGAGPREFVGVLARPIDPHQIFLAGTRDLDADEASFIGAAGISVTPPAGLTDPSALVNAIRARGLKNVYLHLDLDCFDPDEIPDTLLQTPAGPSFDAVAAAHRALREEFHAVGASIVEYVERGGGSLSRLRTMGAFSSLTGVK
jgi:arginase